MATQRPERKVDYLLIGGGLAAATAAETIRKQDSNSSILLVSNETWLPYHRPPLSKEYLRSEIGANGTYGKGGVYVQLPNWYKEQKIEVLNQAEAVTLNAKERFVTLKDGRRLGFETLLLATGGRPRPLKLPGSDLPGVCLLRTLADADAIRARISPGKRIVVIGSGFIGMEVAASALVKGAQVSIVSPQARPWPTMITPELSTFFQKQFEGHGAKLYYGYNAESITSAQEGKQTSVHIQPAQGTCGQAQDITCDFVVVGVGIQLNTELARSAGLAVDDKHGIVVDEHLETQVADIFAAGDVAAYPDPLAQRMHFEHWDNALASGEIAGINMLGADQPYRHVPYFFSDQFDLSINMLGYPSSDAEVVVRGDQNKKSFTALYIEKDLLRAALMVNDDGLMDLMRDLIAAGATAPTEHIKLADTTFDLAPLMPSS